MTRQLDEFYGHLAIAYARLYREDINDRVSRPAHIRPGVSWSTKRSNLRYTIMTGILNLASEELPREAVKEFIKAIDEEINCLLIPRRILIFDENGEQVRSDYAK